MGYAFEDNIPLTSLLPTFIVMKFGLVIEIDGEIHEQQQEYDDGRSAEMEKFGIKVLRFRNYEVEIDSEKVIYEIKNIVKERLKSPPWGI